MKKDVIIIGAGPAGCAAAVTCASHGLDTLIMTALPEETCMQFRPAESVHPGFMSLIYQLNAASSLKLATRGVYEGITIGDRYHPFGNDGAKPWQGFHLDRPLFDAALLQTAAQSEVEVLSERKVAAVLQRNNRITGVVTSDGAEYQAAYVIDAGGAQSIAAKGLGWRRQFYSPPMLIGTGMCRLEPSSQLPEFASHPLAALFVPESNGWSWIAREASYFYSWTRLMPRGTKDIIQPAVLQHCKPYGKIRKFNRRWQALRPICMEGLLLCGDAATLIDPATGQGILQALLSGIEAARTISLCLKSPALESLYLATYDQQLIARFEDQVEKLRKWYVEHRIGW